MKSILVFDTETINLEHPWCYNIGYVIYDLDGKKILLKRDFVIEQVWADRKLFTTAYYGNKRQVYVNAMRGKKAILTKYGFAQRIMSNDIKKYNVIGAYAFNSPFDDSVFKFNSDSYMCQNALDTTPVFDIRPYAIQYLADGKYKEFCDNNESVKLDDGKLKFITDADGYKTTAETFYCYIKDDPEYCEEHTALADSLIELEILLECFKLGATPQTNLYCPRYLPRNRNKKLYLKRNRKIIFETEFVSKTERKISDGISITVR